jgi:CDP-2,3-bis-(O-geranylgeranyl)-sn-glycerol synthase
MLHDVLEILYFVVPAYVANMSPVLVQTRFEGLARPMDRGATFRGKRVLGDHKTWRGLLSGIVTGVLAFELQKVAFEAGYLRTLSAVDYSTVGLQLGILLGLGTGIGDAVKSFFKRQVNIAPGRSWLGFDQLDFLAGAALFASPYYLPPLVPLLLSLPIVLAGSILTTAAGYWLGMKESWL